MNLFTFIKDHISILDVTQQYVALKKAGGYWKGRCPFHSEKTGSFTISPHRGIFYCFGCHEGGDVITFIENIERCSAIQAAHHLIDRFRLEPPKEIFQSIKQESPDEKNRYLKMCNTLGLWCHEQLSKHPSVFSYLTKRGFTQESAKKFSIGYFPEGMRSVKTCIKHLQQKSFLLNDLTDVHIIIKKETRLYSPFEQRIIFPIGDHLGRFCGFGGRTYRPSDERVKYYNSQENNYFHKGTLLFGLDLARKTIQQTGTVFIVEGYTDCIMMHQYGYTNTVATLGTACTVDHLKKLAQHAHTVYVMYDSDDAGQKATMRLAFLCWEANLDLLVILLPQGQDPATFLLENKTLEKQIEQAQTVFSFFVQTASIDFSTKNLQDRLNAVHACIKMIGTLKDPLKQAILLQQAADAFHLPFNALKESFTHKQTVVWREKEKNKLNQEDVSISFQGTPLEKQFLCAILHDTHMLERADVQLLARFMPEEVRRLMRMLWESKGSTDQETFNRFFERLESTERLMVNMLIVSKEPSQDEQLETIILLLYKQYWKKVVKQTKEQISHAQESDDGEKINTIIQQFHAIKKKMVHKGLI